MSPLARIQTVLQTIHACILFFQVTADTVTPRGSTVSRQFAPAGLSCYLECQRPTGRIGIGRPRPRTAPSLPFIRWLLRSRPYYPSRQFLLGACPDGLRISIPGAADRYGGVFECWCCCSSAMSFGIVFRPCLLISLYALVCFGFLPSPSRRTAVESSGVSLWSSVERRGDISGRPADYQQSDRSDGRHSGWFLALALIGLLVGFYFLNWIPPVPLSMKFGGIYHEVKKSDDRFELSFERNWYQVWKRSDTTFPAHEPIYCFTAVFAPVALNTTVYHHWYFRPHKTKAFAHADKIPVKISGGREAGYRAYTFKQQLDPGDWRVDLEAEDGRIIGRVSVTVEIRDESPPQLATIFY